MSLIRGTENPTIDVVLVTIVTESTGKEYALDTASKIGVEPQVEVQEAVKLVIKGVLKAQKPKSSVVTGHVITLTDNVFIPEIVQILQGGTLNIQSMPVYGTGTAQVETATVVGTITTAGNATVVVSSGLFEDVTLTVALALNDTATMVAGKFRTAMLADNDISTNYTIGGMGANITLTAKVKAANDTELNVSIDNATEAGCVGLTTAAVSTNTTAGVAPDMADQVVGYTPPVAGVINVQEEFTMNAYSAQYNEAGEIEQYERISYPNCKGDPIALSSEDGVFRTPEYTINSVPDSGQAPYDLAYVSALPTVS